MARLIEQGLALHRAGELVIRLQGPDDVRAMAADIVDSPALGERLVTRAKAVFDEPSALPDQPDEDTAEAWLHRVRDAHLEDGGRA
jgi:hypothetical protein